MQTNVELKRNGYRRRIMSIIRQEVKASRFDLKKISRYSMTTTLETVEGLLEEGLIIETGMGESTGGRKPTWLSVNPEGGYFFGVEFNAEYIYSIILDFSGAIIYRGQEALPTHPVMVNVVIDRIKQAIRDMQFSLREDARIFGIGLGVPGFIDMEKGVPLKYNYILEWADVSLKQEIEAEFGLPVFIENNVNAMALAHKWLDYHGQSDDILVMAVRTGIRVSAITNNRILRGKHYAAGEIDHLRLPGSKTLCVCGGVGCLVSEVSNRALLAKVEMGFEEERYAVVKELMTTSGRITPSIEDFVGSLRLGDKDSIALAMETARYLGEALSYCVLLNNPARIILSIDWLRDAPVCIGEIKKIVDERCPVYSTRNLRIEASSYGVHVGAIGAASIVLQSDHYLVA